MANSSETLRATLESHTAFFDSMVNLVPAKHYFPVSVDPDAWRGKFQRSAPQRAAAKKKARLVEKLSKRGKYDPDVEDTVVARQALGRTDGRPLLGEGDEREIEAIRSGRGDDGKTLKERLRERLDLLRRNRRGKKRKGGGEDEGGESSDGSQAREKKRARRAESKRERRERQPKKSGDDGGKGGARGKGKQRSSDPGDEPKGLTGGGSTRHGTTDASGGLDLKFSKFDFTPASTSRALMKRDEQLRSGALRKNKRSKNGGEPWAHRDESHDAGVIARGATQGARKVAKAKALLAEAEAKQARIGELRAQGNEDAVVAIGLKDAARRAQGEKLRDDPRLIKKTLKREQKQRAKSAAAWKSRTASVEKAKKEKQDRRSENLRRRRDGEKTLRKGASAPKKRAGFEGKKKQFLNKK